MKNNIKTSNSLKVPAPSTWVKRFMGLVPIGTVLDVAAGSGRHTKLFSEAGHDVTAIDKDVSKLNTLKSTKKIEVISADLENKISIFGRNGALFSRKFLGIIVVNYLHRPLITDLLRALEPGGVLIYETFAVGNEIHSRPRNSNYLLKSGELVDRLRGKLQIIAFEQGEYTTDKGKIVKQKVVGANNLKSNLRNDGEPNPHIICES